MIKVLLIGILLWAAGTVALRLAGRGLLRPADGARTIALYVVSFLLMMLLAPGVFRLLKLDRNTWFQAVTLLTLPTLILDPFSCLFFSRIFPNIAPAAAGAFGGWMLISCAGAIAGVWIGL